MPAWQSLDGSYGDSEYLDATDGFATLEWTQAGAGYEVRVFDYRTNVAPVIRLFPDKPAGKAWAEAQLA